MDSKVARSQLAARTPSIVDYKTTIEFNRLYTSVEKPVEVYWILKHKGIPSNKIADRLAKEGAARLPLVEPPTIS